MFDTKEASTLSPRDLAVCQRVFDHVCMTKQVTLDMHREEVAKRILLAYRGGLRDEGALIRSMMETPGGE